MQLTISRIKIFIGKILTSDWVYNVIAKQGIKNNFIKTRKGLINVENQSTYIKSLLFWGLYENSERKTISRYIKNLPVVELGASIGMTTTTICSYVNKNIPVISVEANPYLIPNLIKTKNINALNNLTIIHSAIDYNNNPEISFSIDNRNLGSKKGTDGNIALVPTIKLTEILAKHNIEQYVLVSDIEGAEAELVLSENEPKVFENCKQIIIELHDTSFNGKKYSKADLVALIKSRFSMEMICNKGQTWVFEK